MKMNMGGCLKGLIAAMIFAPLGMGEWMGDLSQTGDRPIPQNEIVIPGKMDCARDLVVDDLGNAYLTGYSYREGSDVDFGTAKYDPNGKLLWTARYDGPAHFTDYAETIALAGTDGIVVAGHSSGLETSLDMTVVRYERNGKLLWTARYDGPSHRDDYAQDIAVDADGNVLVTGYSFGAGTEYDYVTVKYDPHGHRIWEARHNSTIDRDDAAKAIALDSRGFAYVMGTDRERTTSYDFAVIKYDGEGREVWTARYSGPQDAFDQAEALAVDGEGCAYVTGFGYNGETEYDIVTAKFNSDGRLLWKAIFNGPEDRLDRAQALVLDNSGNAYVTGYSFGLRSAADIVTIKYDRDGRQIWASRYDGPGGGPDRGSSIVVDSGRSVTVAGSGRGRSKNEDIVLIRYDSDGKLLWESYYDGPDHGEDRAAALAADTQGNSYVAGYSYGYDSEADYMILKYDSRGRLLWASRLDGAQLRDSNLK